MTLRQALADSYSVDPDDGSTREVQAQMEQGIAKLIALVSSNAGLQDIVNSISNMFGLPASIIDNNFTYLAYSKDYPEVFACLGDDLHEGYVPMKLQRSLKRSEIFHPTKVRTEPVYFETPLPNGTINRNYVALIYLKHVPVGSFSLFTNGEDISQVELRYMPMVASLLGIEMQKSNFYLLNKINFFSHLLRRLLDESSMINDDTLAQRFAVFGYKLERFKQIVLVDLRDESFGAAGVQAFAEKFQSRLPRSVYFIHEGDIIYLVSSAEPTPLVPEHAREWQQDISATRMRMGVSSVFAPAAQFARALSEAKGAVETGISLGVSEQVLWFDNYRLADLVRRLPKELDLHSYIYPPLLRVLEHDQEHGTRLAYTLSRYLLNPGCPRGVSEELFVHKNTLYYRLNRIRELMQADLDSAAVRAQIHLSFLILRTLNVIDFDIEVPSRPPRPEAALA